MPTYASQRRYSLGDYLRLEEYSNVRHEYLAGQIYAMAGGTPEHAACAANVIGALTAGLRARPCRVYTSDVRIRVQATGLDTYPDVTVVCGHAERDGEDPNALVNPIFLVEVTSPGTADYDRGEKLEQYKQIPSLAEVLIVAHDAKRVELIRRSGDGSWITEEAGPGSSMRLDSLDCDLAVDDIYRDPLAAT